jgi:hypothetical protein
VAHVNRILANEIGVCRQTVQAIRQQMQANAQRLQPDNPLDQDEQTEISEMYQNAGKKVPVANPRQTPENIGASMVSPVT